jgi:hypothetical protein
VPEREVAVPFVGGLDLHGVEAWEHALVAVAGVADDVEVVEGLAVGLRDVGRVDGDEGHPVRDLCYVAEPGVREVVELGALLREAVVERPRELPKLLVAADRPGDVADEAGLVPGDRGDDGRCEPGLLGVEVRELRRFLDKLPYSPESGTHQTPPFVCPIAIGVAQLLQLPGDGRRRNFSSFSGPSERPFRSAQARDDGKLQSNPPMIFSMNALLSGCLLSQYRIVGSAIDDDHVRYNFGPARRRVMSVVLTHVRADNDHPRDVHCVASGRCLLRPTSEHCLDISDQLFFVPHRCLSAFRRAFRVANAASLLFRCLSHRCHSSP